MGRLEVLCVTMFQNDFSKFKEMNIQSDVIFANQADSYKYEETFFGENKALMITTPLRGVGKNRNTAQLNSSGEICLLSDDDVVYYDGYENKIIDAFNKVKDADVLIFNIDTNSHRKQKYNEKIHRCGILSKMPYGAVRVAYRREALQKANVWFTELFGGGSKYPNGEDSMWLLDIRKKGLKIYTHPLIIGKVNMETSTWFTGYDEKFFFGKGAILKATHKNLYLLWVIYMAFRTTKMSKISLVKRVSWMLKGVKAYIKDKVFDDYKRSE